MKKHECFVKFKEGSFYAETLDALDTLTLPYYGIMNQVMRQAETLVCDYDYLLPNGWRAILHLDTPDDIICRLDLQGNKGGGNYAQSKMSMIHSNKERYVSGGDKIADLIHELNITVVDRKDEAEVKWLIEQLTPLEDVCQIPDRVAEILNQKYLIAPYYGAIKIPYETLGAHSNPQEHSDQGEIRIAFSGASEEQDVMFALSLFKTLQQHIIIEQKYTQHWFNLRHLQKVPKVRFWIDQLQITQAPIF